MEINGCQKNLKFLFLFAEITGQCCEALHSENSSALSEKAEGCQHGEQWHYLQAASVGIEMETCEHHLHYIYTEAGLHN